MLNETFLEMSYCSKTLVRKKLKFHPFLGNLGPVAQNWKTHLSLILNETILEVPYCHLHFGKNKLEVIPFWGDIGADFHIWAHWSKIKKCHKLRYHGRLEMLNTLLAFSYPGGKDYMTRNSMFLKEKFFVKFLFLPIGPKM